MSGFIKKRVFTKLAHLWALPSVNSLSCISKNNLECTVRPKIVTVNSKEPVFFPFSIERNKCSSSCDNINKLHAKFCVPNIVKNLNVRVLHLMSRTNEKRHIEWHETCKCEWRLNDSVCDNKQRWNDNKYSTPACKELIIKVCVIRD